MQRLKSFHFKNKNTIYIVCLCGIAGGLPLSRFLISISEIGLLLNWILGGGILKTRNLKNNKIALLLFFLFLLEIIWMLNTSDIVNGLKFIKIKLPLLALPLVIATTNKLTAKQFKFILHVFILAISIGSFISVLRYFHWVGNMESIRNINPFVSHIRFGLMLCFSLFSLFYLTLKSINKKIKIAYIFLALSLFLFMILMQSITGLSILIGVLLVVGGCHIIKTDFTTTKKIIILSGISLLFIGVLGYVYQIYEQNFTTPTPNFEQLEKFTLNGEQYQNHKSNFQLENGHHIWIYIAPKELEKEWNKKSTISYLSKDKKGQLLSATLCRFLTSKNLRKDSVGISKLNKEEIKAIEAGVANVDFMNGGNLKERIYATFWELQNYGTYWNPSGNSLLQRFEYWKTGVYIIKDHWIFGVGTGDVQITFDEYYKKLNSPLDKNRRFRTHNQFLTYWISFGIIGFSVLIFVLFYPLYTYQNSWLYLSFGLIIAFSFLTEDTLETQAGVTFYALFNSLFLLGISYKTKDSV